MQKGRSARIRFCVEHDSGKAIATAKIFLNREEAKSARTKTELLLDFAYFASR